MNRFLNFLKFGFRAVRAYDFGTVGINEGGSRSMEIVTQMRCFFYEICPLSLAVSMISARYWLERK